MNAKVIPAKLLERIQQHHEQGTLEQSLANSEEARRLLAAGRRKGQEANQRKAAERRAFIEAVARSTKTEFPYLTASGVTQEVIQAIHAQGRRHGFRLDRLPKESAICRLIEELGICGK